LQTKATHAISIFLSNCWIAMDIVASAGLRATAGSAASSPPPLLGRGSVRWRARLLHRRRRCSAAGPRLGSVRRRARLLRCRHGCSAVAPAPAADQATAAAVAAGRTTEGKKNQPVPPAAVPGPRQRGTESESEARCGRQPEGRGLSVTAGGPVRPAGGP